MTISTDAVKAALAQLTDPVTGTDYVSGKMFKGAETDAEGNVTVSIELGYPARNRAQAVGEAVAKAVEGVVPSAENLAWAEKMRAKGRENHAIATRERWEKRRAKRR